MAKLQLNPAVGKFNITNNCMFRLKTALLIVFIFAACSENRERQKASNVSKTLVASPSPTIQANLSVTLPSKDEPTIRLENQYCYGGCHEYELSIYSDGKIVFEGIEGVKKLGIVESKIAKANLEKLIRKFEDVGFFRFSDRYITGYNCPGSVVSDADTFQIYYNNGKLSKNISHYRGCRGTEQTNTLEMLEKSVEEAVNIKQWIDW